MTFLEGPKKYSRLVLLVFGSLITGYLYVSPQFIDPNSEAINLVIDSRKEWMVLYTVMIMFYFRDVVSKPGEV